METNPFPPASPGPEPESCPGTPVLPASPMKPGRESRESPIVDVFVGPQGLYPGTRWLIYLGIGVFLAVLFSMMGDIVHHYIRGQLRWNLLAQIGSVAIVILPGFAMARFEDRPFDDFGLPVRAAFGRHFWVGALWGFVGLTALMLALRLAGAFHFGSLALHGRRIAEFAAYYAVIFLTVGLFEEFLVRGYTLWIFAQGMHFWPAAAVLSLAFALMHSFNPGESKPGLVAAGLLGFFFCLTLRRTGSLWWAVGFHMSWDWGESFFYSVPDSGGMSPGHLLHSSFTGPVWLTGGTVGPEGSALVFVVIVAMWVLFDRIYPEVRYGKDGASV